MIITYIYFLTSIYDKANAQDCKASVDFFRAIFVGFGKKTRKFGLRRGSPPLGQILADADIGPEPSRVV